MAQDTALIEQLFTEHFGQRRPGSPPIRLPAAAVAERRSGHLFEQGWHVGFTWGEQDGEAFLEFLAQHRMTDDRRLRIYASGRVEELQAPSGVIVFSADSTPEQRAEIQREHAERQREIYAELHERGLLPPAGENLPAHEINEYLRSHGPDDGEQRGR